jgi:hypothetical protein
LDSVSPAQILPRGRREIVDRLIDQSRIIPKRADTSVAVQAKDPPDLPGPMIMINLSRLALTTHCTQTTLALLESLYLVPSDAISLSVVVMASVAV